MAPGGLWGYLSTENSLGGQRCRRRRFV